MNSEKRKMKTSFNIDNLKVKLFSTNQLAAPHAATSISTSSTGSASLSRTPVTKTASATPGTPLSRSLTLPRDSTSSSRLGSGTPSSQSRLLTTPRAVLGGTPTGSTGGTSWPGPINQPGPSGRITQHRSWKPLGKGMTMPSTALGD